MSEIIYAIQVGELSYINLQILDVKIGRTTNLESRLSQYEQGNRMVEVLDLWQPNSSNGTSECEKGALKIAEKYAYQREGEKFIFLQEGYKKFSENINLLLQNKTDKLQEIHDNAEHYEEGEEEEDEYTGETPETVIFQGNTFEVNTWRGVLTTVAREIYKNEDSFEPALGIRGRERNYFTKDKSDLRVPQKIEASPYYFEGNISAEQTMIIVNQLLTVFDYDENSFEVKCG